MSEQNNTPIVTETSMFGQTYNYISSKGIKHTWECAKAAVHVEGGTSAALMIIEWGIIHIKQYMPLQAAKVMEYFVGLVTQQELQWGVTGHFLKCVGAEVSKDTSGINPLVIETVAGALKYQIKYGTFPMKVIEGGANGLAYYVTDALGLGTLGAVPAEVSSGWVGDAAAYLQNEVKSGTEVAIGSGINGGVGLIVAAAIPLHEKLSLIEDEFRFPVVYDMLNAPEGTAGDRFVWDGNIATGTSPNPELTPTPFVALEGDVEGPREEL